MDVYSPVLYIPNTPMMYDNDEGSPTEVDTDKFAVDSTWENALNQVEVPYALVSSNNISSDISSTKRSNNSFTTEKPYFNSLPFFIQHEAARPALSLRIQHNAMRQYFMPVLLITS
jgi:hypothetical protein